MNLLELKSYVDIAIENAKGFGEDPKEILVSIQVDNTKSESLYSDDIELTYDNDGQALGCVLHGWSNHNQVNIKICHNCNHYDGPIYNGFCDGGCRNPEAPISNFVRGLKDPYKINHNGKCCFYKERIK